MLDLDELAVKMTEKIGTAPSESIQINSLAGSLTIERE